MYAQLTYFDGPRGPEALAAADEREAVLTATAAWTAGRSASARRGS